MGFSKVIYWWIKKKMDDLFFQDNSRIYYINLSKEAYGQMLHYCNESNPYETGGILIGNYSPNLETANILQITPPPKNSTHKKYSFHRSSTELKKILDSAWDQGYYYLGEWHYHPNSPATPSNVDIKQMIDFSKNKNLKCPEPILVIIGGNKNSWEITVSVFSNGKYICLKCYND